MKSYNLSLIYFLFSWVSLFCQSSAVYDINLTTIWDATNHTSVPPGAHWSALVGATHNKPNEFFEIGKVSPTTDGIKDIAELGNTTNFRAEVNAAIVLNKADFWINAGGLANPVGSFHYSDLIVNENFPLVTLVSMLAPSPDWFIGVNSVNLRSGNISINNGWKDTFSIDVFAYDSGTDDGTDYTSPNAVSNPRVPVYKIINSPINGNKMGTITFTFKSSTLDLKETNYFDKIKLFPNPCSGLLRISNPNNSVIVNADIYTFTGSLVQQLRPFSTKTVVPIDISFLNNGIYILNITTVEGKQFLRKFIVE